MKILALESSAAAASVAVCEDEELVAQSLQRTGLTHSATLLPMLEDLLKNAGLALADMDLLAVAAGPGSFTGLRIGVSALKGLAWALDKPCAACSTLESMAWQMAHLEVWCDGGGVCRRHTLITDRIEDETIAPYELCPVMDARRSQVYNARFAVSGGAPVRLTEDRAVSLTDLLAEVKNSQKTQILIGDGAKLCYTAFQESGVPVQLAPPHLRFQTAWGVARCALEQARRGESTTAFALRVDYHRLSQAERERLERVKSGE